MTPELINGDPGRGFLILYRSVFPVRIKRPHLYPHDALTNAEAAVYVGTAWGLTQLQISKQLCVSRKTVWTLQHRMMKKLGVTNKGGVIDYALEHRGVNA